MNQFDGHAYEIRQAKLCVKAMKVLRSLDNYAGALDQFGRGPVVTLLCARGHKLIPVSVEDQGDVWDLKTLPGHSARRSGTVTRNAEPWRAGGVCWTPGCPSLIDYEGHCSQHGGPVEHIGRVRTGFWCRSCRASAGEVTTARLLQLYAAALELKRDRIPIADPPLR